ncbi:TorF family putative porin [Terricaulis silvestris]|uniref:Uncharacterized protein n=1 Tax=Terricaulis silvestris TaxID=2686094 RepID=A0A6I6MJA1_9CAUL|nr:TorF family putative porin [Terricaulis silvestris]QGZ95305.1 hypothetical protein DSM104635_02154 [Terricaulis silvestris]
MLNEQPLVPPRSVVSAVGSFEMPSAAAAPAEMLESAPAPEKLNARPKYPARERDTTLRTELVDFKSTSPVAGHTAKPASAAEERTIDVSFDLAFVSDYRRAGVSRSDGNAAVQGAVDLEFGDGWSAGVSSSTTDSKHANFEIAFYGAKEFDFGDTELTIGALAIVDVDRQRLDFGVAQASIAHPIGPFDVTLAVNYAWEQSHLDDQDNLYVAVRGKSLIGRAFGAPLTLGVSAGRMEGRMAMADVRLDWSASLTADVDGTDIALSYVNNDLDGERGEAAWIVSIARTF